MTRLFGWVAGGFALAQNLPQIVLVHRRRTAHDLSAWALVARVLSLGLYVVHGEHIGDAPTTVISACLLLQCVVLCAQKWWYRQNLTPPTSSEPTPAVSATDRCRTGSETDAGSGVRGPPTRPQTTANRPASPRRG